MPDAIFFFPKAWTAPCRGRSDSFSPVTAWCWDRHWLPKDNNGHIEVYPGQWAEIWGGWLSLGCAYVALKFI